MRLIESMLLYLCVNQSRALQSVIHNCLNISIFQVVHCMGCLKLWSPSTAGNNKKCQPFCFVGIGVPLMFSPTFEVPLDRCTFTSHHALDLKFIYCEDG